MGVLDDLRREVTKALEEARREAMGTPPVSLPPSAPRTGSGGRLERQTLERAAPTSGSGLIKERDLAASGTPAFDFDLGMSSAPLIPPREVRPLATAESEAPEAALKLTLTQQDIIRAIMLGEAIDEPKGRRARRPHPR